MQKKLNRRYLACNGGFCVSDKTPFAAAHENLKGAAACLSDLLLPEGHPARQEGDDVECLARACRELEDAVDALWESGVERSGPPSFETRVVDAQIVDAAHEIESLAKPLQEWKGGGERVGAAQLDGLRTALAEIGDRLSDDAPVPGV